ncbi:MAG TPA: hypothetical protein PKX92_12440 [Edaphocola sp.]|nr:hypothetical protein [Edaphocola sp.]
MKKFLISQLSTTLLVFCCSHLLLAQNQRDDPPKSTQISKEEARKLVANYLNIVANYPNQNKLGYTSLQFSDLKNLVQEMETNIKPMNTDEVQIYIGQDPNTSKIVYIYNNVNNPNNFFILTPDRVSCPKQCDIYQTTLWK